MFNALAGREAVLPRSFLDEIPGLDEPPAASRLHIYRRVLAALRSGELAPGARLPASRQLARDWGVPRGAVDEALTQLAREGCVERRVGRGSFVANPLPAALRMPPAAPQGPLNAAARQALQSIAPLLRVPVHPGGGATPRGARMRPRSTDVAHFPLAAWRRCLGRALAESARGHLYYGAATGTPQLREATARHLALTRSLVCRPEQVVIVNSTMQALDLVQRVLLEPGSRVCVEDPGWITVPRYLSLAHMQVCGVGVDAQGFDVGQAMAHAPDAAAVCLYPLSHFPTGARTSAARRTELLDWAGRRGLWVLEGDHLNEIVHDAAAPPALACTDRAERVLSIGSYNALMFPGIRLGWLVVPERLVDVFAAMRGMLGDHSPVAPQLALAEFIDAGHLGAHVRQLRLLYRQRRDALAAAARRLPAGLEMGRMDVGVHALLPLPAATDDVALAAHLATQGLGMEPLSAYAWQGGGGKGLVMGYGDDDAPSIAQALSSVASALTGESAGAQA
jgi:GntR family transcriptional regulator/MocR family aminotransferase